jgi:signal peptidase I
VKTILFGPKPRVTAIRAAVLIATSVVIFGFVLLPIRLTGISMEPTYSDGQMNFANRLAYAWRDPSRGDVVAIRMAGPSVVYVKRIIGLPGERIEIAMGVVKVNGEPLLEPTVVKKAAWNLPPLTLGPGEYFVVGDNRSMSIRNHELGRTTRERLVGKLLF